jgi:hypothetical protein
VGRRKLGLVIDQDRWLLDRARDLWEFHHSNCWQNQRQATAGTDQDQSGKLHVWLPKGDARSFFRKVPASFCNALALFCKGTRLSLPNFRGANRVEDSLEFCRITGFSHSKVFLESEQTILVLIFYQDLAAPQPLRICWDADRFKTSFCETIIMKQSTVRSAISFPRSAYFSRGILTGMLGIGLASYHCVGFSQEIIYASPSANVVTQVRHVGQGPIDLNNLPADVLNCEVCRQRLGLPPLQAGAAKVISPSTNAVPTTISLPSMGTTTNTNTNTNTTNPAPTTTAKMEQPRAVPSSQPIRMLGSPGLMSSLTAEQMLNGGLVVEEFRPPQAPQDAVRLDGIPFEVRQQFLRSLELPMGAKVMSAKVVDPNAPKESQTEIAESVPAVPNNASFTKLQELQPNPPIGSRSLGGPGIVSQSPVQQTVAPAPAVAAPSAPPTSPAPPTPTPTQSPSTISPPPRTIEQPVAPKSQNDPQEAIATAAPAIPKPVAPKLENPAKVENTPSVPKSQFDELRQANELLQRQLQDLASKEAKQRNESEKIVADQLSTLAAERDAIKQQRLAMEEKLVKMQEEWQIRMAQSDAANKEVLSMLEKRTVEVTELQAKIQQQQAELAKAKAEMDAKAEKPDAKKKEKKKHPIKPVIET